MTEMQALVLVQQNKAVFIAKKDGIEWWRLPDRNWLAVRKDGRGSADVRQVPASACGC